MQFSDMQLLQRWALLMLQISIERTAREPVNMPAGQTDSILDRVTTTNVLESKGYRALRAWFARISPGAKQRARTWMRTQLDGVTKLKAQFEANGEPFSYADLEFDIKASNETGELLTAPEFGDPTDSTAPTTGDGVKQPSKEQPT